MNRAKKTVISFFIVFNFLIMVRVHLPLDKKFFTSLYRPIDKYLSLFSLQQSWEMFAPDPSRINAFITAEISYADNSKDTFLFPRSGEMSLGMKYIKGERYRVISEAIRNDSGKHLWPDAAKYALRKIKGNKNPVSVDLNRHWEIIPDMNQMIRPHLYRSSSYYKYKFYTYKVPR